MVLGKSLLFSAILWTALPVNAQSRFADDADSLMSVFAYRAAADAYRVTDAEMGFRQLNGLSTAENMLGLDFLAFGEKDSAEVHFERAIEAAERMYRRYPDSADTHFNLAATYGNLALFKGGKAKVRIGRDVERYALRAVEIDSTHADALSLLGVFYREVAKLSWIERFAARALFGGLPSASLEKSEHYLRRATEVDPASPFATFELGQTLIEVKRPVEAAVVFRRLMSLTPRNSENARFKEVAATWLASHD